VKLRQLFAFVLPLLIWVLSLPLSPPPCYALLKEARSLMGTVVEITIQDPDESKARTAMGEAFAEIRRIEGLMSFYRPDSEISRINRAAANEKVGVSEEVFHLLQDAQTLSRLTEGAFDITFSPLWQLWGECAKEKRLPSREELARAKSLVDYRRISLFERARQVKLTLPGMKVNLGGIAKAYALNRAGVVLQDAGLNNFLINMGGDVLAAGEGRDGRGWRIGIQHPRRGGGFIGVLRLRDCFSLTSGDYERYFKIQGKRYHHILDPRSGYPASGCSAVTVLTPRLSRNYVPSVALFLLGPERAVHLLKRYPEMAALIVTPEGKVIRTPNLSPYLEGPLPPQIDMAESD